MTDIEGFHPLLDESKHHVQGGVTWSKNKLVTSDEVVGENLVNGTRGCMVRLYSGSSDAPGSNKA